MGPHFITCFPSLLHSLPMAAGLSHCLICGGLAFTYVMEIWDPPDTRRTQCTSLGTEGFRKIIIFSTREDPLHSLASGCLWSSSAWSTVPEVVWQPYEAELEDLPPWCVTGKAVWITVSLVCFHLIEKHTPDRVIRQFGMIQEIPHHVDTDTVLHEIDLRGKVGVDWTRKHAGHIIEWGNRLQRRCEAVLGDMPPQHEYFDWFTRVTRRFIDRPGAKLILMIGGYIRLLRRHPMDTEDYKDITDVLKAVKEIDCVQPPIPEALNEEAATPAAAAT
ncbi:hypothetical protein SO802_018591 [Lithocarpus litseifolius]|uniref:Aminotransferase-like plant mobile domain-containing protein n=1 Tax=Lithocarpus litseifolius TaxID=425828 RepID=A0AAW2CNA7_9ROSI